MSSLFPVLPTSLLNKSPSPHTFLSTFNNHLLPFYHHNALRILLLQLHSHPRDTAHSLSLFPLLDDSALLSSAIFIMDMNYQTGNMDLDFVSSPFSAAPSPFDTSAVKDMDIQSLNLYPPLDPPSREDWERFKPVILEQYVGLNLTVKELVHHMEMWYQFKATYVRLFPRLNCTANSR